MSAKTKSSKLSFSQQSVVKEAEENEEEEMQDGNTPSINAIEDEDTDLAIEMLDTEPHESLYLDAINYNNMNALLLACRNGMAQVALRLIDAGVDVNYIGGRGFRAVDYAIATRDAARKTVEDADSQMKFAAEDEQWSLVCEWQSDKHKSQTVLAEYDELIQVLEKQSPDASSHISESELREQFNRQLMRYVRNGMKSRVAWNPENGNVWSLAFLHIMRIYTESQCYMTVNNDIGIDVKLDFDRNIAFLYDDNVDDKTNTKRNRAILKKLAERAVECIKRGKTQVIVPVAFGNANATTDRHSNMLIFRESEWAVEHYEPHGKTNLIEDISTASGRKRIKQMHTLLGNLYSEFVDELNSRLKKTAEYKKRGPVKLHMSSDVCPSHRGFQALQKHDTEFEAIGLCSVWSLFIAEMSAAYPTLTLRQIQGAIYHKMGEFEMSMAGDFLLNLMKGYVTQIVESTRLYCSFFGVEPAEWSFATLNKIEDATNSVSWLIWLESKTSNDPDFIQHRISAHKQGDPEVGEEEVKYIERYVRMKKRLACFESNDTYSPFAPEPPAPAPEPVAKMASLISPVKPKKKHAKSKKVSSKGGRRTRKLKK